MVSIPSVTIAGLPASGGSIARPLEIVHGRASVDTQPDPSGVVIEWCEHTCPWRLGDTVWVDLPVEYLAAVYDDPVVTYDDPRALYDGSPTGTRRRFSGYIAGIEATEQLGPVQVWLLDCVGTLAPLGRLPVKATRPVESDTVRAAQLAAAAGTSITLAGTPQVSITADDLDGDLLGLLQELSESSGGLVWQSRSGAVVYSAADHRQTSKKPIGALTPADIVDEIVWTESWDSIVNEVRIEYGPDATRAESTIRDAASIAQPWGLRHVDINSQLQALGDANILGALIVARRKDPYWSGGPPLVVDSGGDVGRLLAAIDVSSVLMVPISVAPGQLPAALAPYVVEGWVETWDEGMEHTMSISLSDQRRWVLTTKRTYTQVQAVGTYSQVLALGTYVDVLVQEV